MDPLLTPEQEIKRLEAELRREREISASERRRAELLEAACRQSWRAAFGVRPAREDNPTTDTK
jgi:hypothetical protein